ncbi:MAG: PspC domain-containing protein [Actinophytocola sp.]|nr:PspC domain-containing protein [Actinophytocola sp.]
MTSAAGGRPSTRDGIEDTAKDFWSSRPRRPRNGRKIAGVAAGIGNRYGIDPVLVRVGFVIATIVGGFGVLLYLLGWLFLPQEGDEVSGAEALFGKGRSSMSTGLTIVLCLLLFPAVGSAFGGGWMHGGGFVLLALFLLGLYALHRKRGHEHRPIPAPSEAGPATFTARTPDTESNTATADTDAPGPGYGDLRATGVPDDVSTPGGWDPLGAAPLGWDLPGPDAAPQPSQPATPTVSAMSSMSTASTMPVARPRLKSRISYVFAGLALLTASVGLTLGLAGVNWFSAAHVIGLTLGVLGLGMVAASFAGAGRGLVLFAIPLAAAGIVLTAIPFDELPGGGMGEVDETPTSLDTLEPLYQSTMGSVRLDLTQLDAAGEPIETKVDVGMGEAVVTVPADADVTFTCQSAMGSVDCLGDAHEGMGRGPVSGTDYGDDGEGGQQIDLDVESRMGSVVIERG